MLRRKRSLRLVFASLCVVLGLNMILFASMRLMLTPAHATNKEMMNELPWRTWNASRIFPAKATLHTGKTETIGRNNSSSGDQQIGKGKGLTQVPRLADPQRFRRVRVLCWILTSPSNLHTKAAYIKQTWGPRCDKTLYMSSKAEPDFPAIGLDIEEGRKNLWSKTRLAFQYVYDHYFQDADWFMKSDDDTYAIIENLRYFLSDKNSSEPLYYGHNFKTFMKQGYMSGGSGYVMSKEALHRFINTNKTRCRRYYSSEDVGVGHCLEEMGVVAGDSRDSLNRFRFLPFSIEDFVNHRLPGWYHKYKKYNESEGLGCCSDYLISCHYVPPQFMPVLDYIIYHLRLATKDDEHSYDIGNNRTVLI